jgi:hypothetical protein
MFLVLTKSKCLQMFFFLNYTASLYYNQQNFWANKNSVIFTHNSVTTNSYSVKAPRSREIYFPLTKTITRGK